jgi:hypothetical protein
LEENLIGQLSKQIPPEADKLERSEIPRAQRFGKQIIKSSYHHISISAYQHIITSAHHHISTSSHHHISTSSHHHISTSDFPTPQRPNRYEENLLGQPISTNQQIPPEADKLERSEIPRAQRSVKQIIISSYQHISTSAHHHIITSDFPTPQRPNKYEENLLGRSV